MICPICESSYSEMFKWINCESFDDSNLYKDIHIEKCNNCGHVFNILTNNELRNLTKYYEDEYALSNLSLNDSYGDRPGSDNLPSLERYEHVFDFIVDRLKENARILDVGCALGGFLRYCETKGYFNSFGIEPIEEYVKASRKKRVRHGNVYDIPFPDNSFDLVVLDQVLEHLVDPRLAMKEINRVLDKSGLVYIGVPDVDRYDDYYFYISREHIQHFNLITLKILAEKNGFELLDYIKTSIPMIGTLKLPNLSVLLKPTGTMYCWGIGREFMYLYPNTRLKNLDLILVDDTPEKQKHTFKGMKIWDSNILEIADKDSFLIITAKVYEDRLKQKAKELGYKGEIINV